METGTIASWYLKVGDSFGAGDAVAKIETDKASIDFEAQDDGFIAKILVQEGGEDVAVGAPIMITVEDEADVAAFQDYVLPATIPAAAATPPPPPAAAVEPPVVAAAAAPPVAPPVVTPVAAPVAPPPPVVAAVAPPVVAAVTTPVPTMGPAWGSSARVTSPIAKTLASKQKAYIALYGSTGQLPL